MRSYNETIGREKGRCDNQWQKCRKRKGKRECDMFNNGEAEVKAEVEAELEALRHRGYFLFALLKLRATQ